MTQTVNKEMFAKYLEKKLQIHGNLFKKARKGIQWIQWIFLVVRFLSELRIKAQNSVFH